MKWRTAVEMFEARVAASGGATAMRVKERGTWQPRTWNDWARASLEIGAGLRGLGVENGDRVAVLANSRAEWFESDVGILLAGAVTVPIYQSNTPKECEYILVDSQTRVVIAEDPHQLEKLLAVRAALGHVRRVVVMSDTAHLEKPDAKGRTQVALADVLGDDARAWVSSLADLRKEGRAWLEKNALDAAKNTTPDDIFTIVYTSGTTGPPKGVVLTHKNICFICDALAQVIPLTAEDEQVLFLPLAHIFAKSLEWTCIAQGAVTAFAESISKLTSNMQEVRPTFFGAVPRVYEKAYTKILGNFEAKRSKAAGRFVIDRAMAAGKRRSALEQAGQAVTGLDALAWRLADKLVFEKVRAIFGGRVRFCISGGAPIAREIAEFFHVCGMTVLEGYGLTETTAATHINTPNAYRFGCVGRALPGVDVKIADDGEILVRGDNMLREYFGKPDATREALDPESAGRWFHTGDIGVIDDGFLRITDRKKDLIVTAGGKNVAPQNIEGAWKAQCQYVSQVMVHGDKRSYLTALVTLNEETVSAWAKEKGLSAQKLPELASEGAVIGLIQGAVDRLNKELASYETIKKFKILPSDFSQDAGELTPTLKVKRKFVSEKYRSELDSLYGAENP
jgi:long-chain acyl-CoA synthetase